MIRDKRTRVYTAALDPDDCDEEPFSDFRCELPLEPDDLYDITPNIIATGTVEERAAALDALSAADGWRLDLVDDGEKSLSASITLSGKVFFTTFSPVVDLVGCGFSAGTGYLYAIDLFTGVGVPDPDVRRENPGDLIFQTPSPFYPPPKPPCEGENCEDEPDERETMLLLPDGPHSSGTSLDGPYGSFWHREDY
jgi:type IV pilus assembly protein PilY1